MSLLFYYNTGGGGAGPAELSGSGSLSIAASGGLVDPLSPSLTSITGSLYRPNGVVVTSGQLVIRPSSFITNGSFFLHTSKPVVVAVPGSGLLSFSLAPGNYVVEFDPSPADLATPTALKVGYFKKLWSVPSSGPIDIVDL